MTTRTAVSAAEPPERPRNEIRWPTTSATTATTGGWVVIDRQR